MSIIANIFEIQRYCIHDGPGIRTTVFFKGCPLSCVWCCNPESQNLYTEIGFFKEKCIGCKKCKEVCPKDNIIISDIVHFKDIKQCRLCTEKNCVSFCPSCALTVYGKRWTVNEVTEEVIKDKMFYEESGGGVTVSGGEALLQADFVKELFLRCKDYNINTAIETCGYVSWDAFEKVVPLTDYIIMDIKHVNKKNFFDGTGGDSKIVMDNFEKLLDMGKQIEVRIPLIPNFNSDFLSFQQICTYLKKCNVKNITILPFHKLAKEKYNSLGRKYAYKDTSILSDEYLEKIKKIALSYGIKSCFFGI